MYYGEHPLPGTVYAGECDEESRRIIGRKVMTRGFGTLPVGKESNYKLANNLPYSYNEREENDQEKPHIQFRIA